MMESRTSRCVALRCVVLRYDFETIADKPDVTMALLSSYIVFGACFPSLFKLFT